MSSLYNALSSRHVEDQLYVVLSCIFIRDVSFNESVLFHASLYNVISSRYVGDLLYAVLSCVSRCV